MLVLAVFSVVATRVLVEVEAMVDVVVLLAMKIALNPSGHLAFLGETLLAVGASSRPRLWVCQGGSHRRESLMSCRCVCLACGCRKRR